MINTQPDRVREKGIEKFSRNRAVRAFPQKTLLAALLALATTDAAVAASEGR